jgi:YesN/AraC family two-component response regulator
MSDSQMIADASLKEKMSTLIIDDEEDIREIFIEILKRNAYKNVESVGSGEEAIDLFKKQHFDIALIDLNLPDINGIDLITKLRVINPDAEFIIITGYGSLDYAIKAMQIDVGAFLEKPVSSDKLLRTLEEVMIKLSLKLENQKFLEDLELANNEILFLNDLLVNNVDELNQSLLLTMVQIEKLNPTDEQKKVLRLFQQAIRKNARLTRNIKKLQTIDDKSESDLKSIEFSKIFTTVLNRLRNDYSDKKFEIIGDVEKERVIHADNDLMHLLTELFLISILNDPSPKIRINVKFDEVEKDQKNYLKMNVKAFQVKHIYDQREITQPTDLKIATNEHSFQDLGPFIINSLIRLYQGFVELPDEESSNLLDIYLPIGSM